METGELVFVGEIPVEGGARGSDFEGQGGDGESGDRGGCGEVRFQGDVRKIVLSVCYLEISVYICRLKFNF